jgi:hypothetical protein
MRALSVMRGGAIGLAAVAAPAAALGGGFLYIWSAGFSGWAPYTAILCLTLALVAGLAWACVRIAHFPPRAAIVLTTWPFIVGSVVSVPMLAAGSPFAFLFWLVQLAVAVFIARTAARRAQK